VGQEVRRGGPGRGEGVAGGEGGLVGGRRWRRRGFRGGKKEGKKTREVRWERGGKASPIVSSLVSLSRSLPPPPFSRSFSTCSSAASSEAARSSSLPAASACSTRAWALDMTSFFCSPGRCDRRATSERESRRGVNMATAAASPLASASTAKNERASERSSRLSQRTDPASFFFLLRARASRPLVHSPTKKERR